LAGTTADGGPTIDCVDVNPVVVLTRVEAESGTCDDAIDSNHAGFAGTGVCKTTNAVGSIEALTLNAASGGPTQVRIRFCNGTIAYRPTSIAVNGTTAMASHSFPAKWDTRPDTTVTLSLNAGANTATFNSTTTTAGGGRTSITSSSDQPPTPPPLRGQLAEVQQGWTGANPTPYGLDLDHVLVAAAPG
jgi:hypothetical protein